MQSDDLSPKNQPAGGSQRRAWLAAIGIIVVVAIIYGIVWSGVSKNSQNNASQEDVKKENLAESASSEVEGGDANLRVITVTDTAPAGKFKATGAVEPDQQQLQQITVLASGRVETVNVALGDRVHPGTLLLSIKSPQVAEMHGKLHEAETKLRLAKITMNRVKQSANRVAILKAKASLDEAESTLKRTKQLVQEGLTAGRELIAAESEYERASAEYNFQKDITLNREVSEAQASLNTAKTEAEHIRDALKVMDAQMPEGGEGSEHDISTLQLRSPIAGVVIERLVNPGAGVEAGKSLMTIANTSSLWVIANVPEREMPNVQLGMRARVILDGKDIAGTVSYIDPRLNEDTRTSRVRIVIPNPDNRIQAGSFAQIEFRHNPQFSKSVYVPSSSVQTVEGRTVVFVKQADGKFKTQAVDVGEEIEGQVPICQGLASGEQIAANGSFILKSKLLKSQLGGED